MAYINVDHSKFSGAASAIDTYVSQLRSKMNMAQSEVNTMANVWQGSDYTNFKAQWDKVTAGDSTYSEMVKALESYSKFLKYAAENIRALRQAR